MDHASLYASSGASPQSVWSLVLSSGVLYGRYWKQFLLASGSVTALSWVIIGASHVFGHDIRTFGALALPFGILTFLYAVALLTIIAGEASEKDSISLWHVYRRSPRALVLSAGALVGVALAMGIVLFIPLLGLLVALYLYLRLSSSLELAVLENLAPLKAMRRSWSLTKGRSWIALLHALLQHGYLVALVVVLVFSPHAAIGVLLVTVALPALVIVRVLSYLDLRARQRLDGAPTPHSIS